MRLILPLDYFSSRLRKHPVDYVQLPVILTLEQLMGSGMICLTLGNSFFGSLKLTDCLRYVKLILIPIHFVNWILLFLLKWHCFSSLDISPLIMVRFQKFKNWLTAEDLLWEAMLVGAFWHSWSVRVKCRFNRKWAGTYCGMPSPPHVCILRMGVSLWAWGWGFYSWHPVVSGNA